MNKNAKGEKKQAKLKNLNTRVKVYEATVITMIQTEPYLKLEVSNLPPDRDLPIVKQFLIMMTGTFKSRKRY